MNNIEEILYNKETFKSYIKDGRWFVVGQHNNYLEKFKICNDKLVSICIGYNLRKELYVEISIVKDTKWGIKNNRIIKVSYDYNDETKLGDIDFLEYMMELINQNNGNSCEVKLFQYFVNYINEYNLISKKEYFEIIERVNNNQIAEFETLKIEYVCG